MCPFSEWPPAPFLRLRETLYHIGDKWWLGLACASVQSHQSLHCPHIWSMEVDKGSAKNQTSRATGWLRMHIWWMSLRRTKSAIISWDGSFGLLCFRCVQQEYSSFGYRYFNPYLPSGLGHPYQLEESISNFRGVWCNVSFYFIFWLKFLYANSADTDQTTRSAASDLDLHCLLKSQKRGAWLIWVKHYAIKAVNNKGIDQTAQICRLICAFVVRIWHKQVFSL